ncbi:hypothetical protein OROMI_027919 [Orobanche minor]
MREYCKILYFFIIFALFLAHGANGEDPYRFFTWKITYGDIYPLGVKQQGILINRQFPGPQIDAVTNENLVINVFNYLTEPFLLSCGWYTAEKELVAGWNAWHKLSNFTTEEFHLQAGDWFKTNHYILRRYFLERGRNLPAPDGLLINGRGWNGYTFTVEPGKTYRFRISNVGITADQPAQDYYVVISSRFTTKVLTTTTVLHYSNSRKGVSGPIPWAPTNQVAWSLSQARSIRWNLTASGPRPNPQGSYHYGMIKPSRTIMLANSAPWINGKQRYAVNGVSYIPADTPLKLADHLNIPGVFYLGSIQTNPPGGSGGYLATSVMQANFWEFVEIIFQNWEDTVQSWHIDGYSFFVLGMDGGQWTQGSRVKYNLRDTVARSTVQVYPRSWTAISMSLDNVGMWNIRSENWARQYLGRSSILEFTPLYIHGEMNYQFQEMLFFLCGRARGHRTRPL